MRKRNNRIWCRLNDKEYCQLKKNIIITGLTQESYLRKLIMGTRPKEAPPIEYHQMIQILLVIGNNLNQITTKLNSINKLDSNELQMINNQLRQAIVFVQKEFE